MNLRGFFLGCGSPTGFSLRLPDFPHLGASRTCHRSEALQRLRLVHYIEAARPSVAVPMMDVRIMWVRVDEQSMLVPMHVWLPRRIVRAMLVLMVRVMHVAMLVRH